MKLSDRKTRLTFITNQTARYRGKEREIVIEVFPEHAATRLLGTRTRYEISWRGGGSVRHGSGNLCSTRARTQAGRKSREKARSVNRRRPHSAQRTAGPQAETGERASLRNRRGTPEDRHRTAIATIFVAWFAVTYGCTSDFKSEGCILPRI